MAWTGNWLTKEIDGLFGLATSKNWSDFSRSVKQFGVPGQNIVYADVEGNIGWRPAVFLPIRKEGFSLVPRPGDDPTYDWSGRVPFKKMPFMLNPKKDISQQQTIKQLTIVSRIILVVCGLTQAELNRL